MPLLRELADLFSVELKTAGWLSAVSRVFGGAQILRFTRHHKILRAQPLFKRYVEAKDSLFYLSHRFYLSQRFSHEQRLGCAITHYRYDGARHNEDYAEAVYRNGGLELWSSSVNGGRYSIKLCQTTNPRNEGGNSVVLAVDEKWLCEMSFVWLEGSVIGAPKGILPFITRNQSVHPKAEHLVRFRQDFPQNSPAYFCLAAIHGIARAHGKQHIAAIRHDCQIAYEPRYLRNFRNSYTNLWKSFGGTEVGGHAYLMPVPVSTVPITDIPPKHRGRAIDRRRHWASIAGGAVRATSRHMLPESEHPTSGNQQGLSLFLAQLPALLWMPLSLVM